MTTKQRSTYGTTVEATFVGRTKGDDGWEHFAWSVKLTRDGLEGAGPRGKVTRVLPYNMGLAHVQTKCGKPIASGRHQTSVYPCEHFKCQQAGPQPTPPDLYDVLTSFKADQTHGETFNDWAEGLGMSTDSRKAMDLYLACQQSEVESRRFFGEDWPKIVADEDYE